MRIKTRNLSDAAAWLVGYNMTLKMAWIITSGWDSISITPQLSSVMVGIEHECKSISFAAVRTHC